jgi:uncharacterized protein (TIGR02453 family)
VTPRAGGPREAGQPQFTGFPEEALDFYEGLEADPTKAYWTDHKAVYERAVRGPMLALCAVLEPEYGPAKIFRPYRDVRFSADKTPYKTAQGAVLRGPEGGHVWYVQLSAAGLMVATGYHEMASDQVQRFRAAVDDDTTGEQLAALVEDLQAAGHLVEGDRMKTRPRGTAPDHPRLDLLRLRTLTARHQFGPSPWLHTPEAAGVVRRTWQEMAPLDAWLAQHVGDSHLPRR